MAKDGEEKSLAQCFIDGYKGWEEVFVEGKKDPFEGEHLSIVKLGQWADRELPENFLEKYLALNEIHIPKCERCRKLVEIFKAIRQVQGGFNAQ